MYKRTRKHEQIHKSLFTVRDYVFVELTNMTKFYESLKSWTSVSMPMAAFSFLFAGAVMGRDMIAEWMNITPTNV